MVCLSIVTLLCLTALTCSSHAAHVAVNKISTAPVFPFNEVSRQSSGSLRPTCGLSFPSQVGTCLTAEEVRLGSLINDYRASVGKSRLPVVATLSTVAQAHAYDSEVNSPTDCGGNMHSWSGACSTWTAVCYSSDHAQAAGMWGKPAEFNPSFVGPGFEISAWYSAGQSAERALGQWQGSPPHNDVMVENGFWGPFGGMGIGIYENFAHVWFSNSADPAGQMAAC